MEKNGSINRIWKMSIVWTFIGCLILLLILNYQTCQKSSFSAPLCQLSHLPTTSTLSMTTSNLQQTPEVAASSNITISNHTTTPTNTTNNFQQTPEVKPQIAASDNITINGHMYTTSTTTNTSRSEANDQVKSDLIEKVLQREVTKKRKKKMKKKCNIFEGRWVYDPKQVPSYDAERCPILENSFRCQENGRPDSEYLKWRWEATDCDIPLFNGTDMLERLRNKKMIVVGDSLNKNQWYSLACLLIPSISDPSIFERHGCLFLIAKDYNFTMEFHWSAFLVEFDLNHVSGRKVLVLDKISSSSEQWRGADIMLFNSLHWWTHARSVKTWDAFEYKGKLIEDMRREDAYKRGMETWARWMENNVDPKKSTVFFRTKSESHFGKDWCPNTTQPSTDVKFYKSHIPKEYSDINKRVITRMSKLKVKYLSITKLSQYRRDAHPSMYVNLNWKNGTKKFDCGHWCLPGLPDTWNRLLYASLFFDTSTNRMFSF